MKTDFTFHFPTDTTDILIEAHREGDEIELDHVWLKNTDILPILEFENNWFHSFLLEKIYEAGAEYRRDVHRESLMA